MPRSDSFSIEMAETNLDDPRPGTSGLNQASSLQMEIRALKDEIDRLKKAKDEEAKAKEDELAELKKEAKAKEPFYRIAALLFLIAGLGIGSFVITIVYNSFVADPILTACAVIPPLILTPLMFLGCWCKYGKKTTK